MLHGVINIIQFRVEAIYRGQVFTLTAITALMSGDEVIVFGNVFCRRVRRLWRIYREAGTGRGHRKGRHHASPAVPDATAAGQQAVG